MTLGEQLTRARGDKSKKEFAKHLGITPQTLGRLENGSKSPSYKLLQHLTKKLGLDLNSALAPDAGLEDEPTVVAQ